MYQILVAASLSEAGLQLLKGDSEVSFEVVKPPLDEAAYELLSDSDALIVSSQAAVDEELLGCAPELKVIGRSGAGLDNIDVAACRAHNVEVVYAPGANTQAVVEYVLCLLGPLLRCPISLCGRPSQVLGCGTPWVLGCTRR